MPFAVDSSVPVSPRQLTFDFDLAPLSSPCFVHIHAICDGVSAISWDVVFLCLVPNHPRSYRTAADASNGVPVGPIKGHRTRISLLYIDRRQVPKRVTRSRSCAYEKVLILQHPKVVRGVAVSDLTDRNLCAKIRRREIQSRRLTAAAVGRPTDVSLRSPQCRHRRNEDSLRSLEHLNRPIVVRLVQNPKIPTGGVYIHERCLRCVWKNDRNTGVGKLSAAR